MARVNWDAIRARMKDGYAVIHSKQLDEDIIVCTDYDIGLKASQRLCNEFYLLSELMVILDDKTMTAGRWRVIHEAKKKVQQGSVPDGTQEEMVLPAKAPLNYSQRRTNRITISYAGWKPITGKAGTTVLCDKCGKEVGQWHQRIAYTDGGPGLEKKCEQCMEEKDGKEAD